MGGSYENITVATTDLNVIRAALQKVGRNALVSAPDGGRVVVFDQQSGESDWGPLAAALSAECRCPALAAVEFDGDILQLELWQVGRRVTTYVSNRAYPEEGQPAGDPRPFQSAFAPAADLRALTRVFQRDDYVFEQERHDEIVGLLGLPDAAVEWSWLNLQDDPAARADLGVTAITTTQLATRQGTQQRSREAFPIELLVVALALAAIAVGLLAAAWLRGRGSPADPTPA